MNSYIVQILHILLSNNGEIDLSSVMKNLHITKRMFLYYWKQLNEYLKQCSLPETVMKDDILKINVENTKDLMVTLIKAVPLSTYILNAIERQECVLIKIGITKDAIRLEDLISEFDVSRNTMIKDITAIKKYLTKFDIQLSSKQKCGYVLEGDEYTIRYIIMKAYHHRDNIYIDMFKKNLMLSHLQDYVKTDEYILDEIQDILIESERLGNENFIFLVLPDLSQTLLLMYMRSQKCMVDLSIHITLDKNRRMLDFITTKLNDYGIELHGSQAAYVYLILQSAKVSSLDIAEYEDDVIALAHSIITEFEAASQLNLTYHKSLLDMFLLHIKSMYYRTKYKIKITNFQEIETEEHQGFYYLTKKIMENISRTYNLLIDDDEIRFLSYYFTCLENKDVKDAITQENIVVVCVSGLGSSVFLKHQLTKLFENLMPIVISDIRNINHIVNKDTKLIITTMDFDRNQHLDKDVIKVNTVLSQQNKRELLTWFLNDNIQKKENIVVHDIIDIIKSYTIIQNQEKLFQQLHQYFNVSTIGEQELPLKDMFDEQYIRIYDKADTWQQMVYLASEPLIKDDVIKRAYLDDIIQVIEQYGLYCECLNGVLVAHASPHQNVKRPVLSLAVFHQPLFIKKWQKEISSVFILGVVDKESHAFAFSQLITKLSQDELYKKLHLYTSTKELYNEIIACP